MKMIRNISGYAKVLAGAFLAALLEVSCTQVEIDVPYVRPGDEHAVKVTFTLGHPEALLDEENQDTKSYLTRAGIDTYISGVTLAIYETGGTQAYLGYVTSGFNAVDITLLNNKTYNIYAVANMGDQRTALASAIEGGTLSSMTYTVDYSTMNSIGIPMAKSLTGQTFTDGGSLTVYLQRLLAKINVSLSCDWPEAAITGATVKNVNPKVAPFGEIAASRTNPATLQDIHGTLPGTGTSLSAVFYVPENNKGTVGSVANATQKTYSNDALSGIRDYATYLEVDVTTTGDYDGAIKYRSYLGANETTDFNIERNEVYNWSIIYHYDNIETYDWKRDTDGLYRYELVCISDAQYVTVGTDTKRTAVLEYQINQYSVRTGVAVNAFYPTVTDASFYGSMEGSDVSDKLTVNTISGRFLNVAVGSNVAGPVYVEAEATYLGKTYHTSSRALVHANGIESVRFQLNEYTLYYYPNVLNVGGLNRVYYSAEGTMPYEVTVYADGTRSTTENVGIYGVTSGYISPVPDGNFVTVGTCDGYYAYVNGGVIELNNYKYPGCYLSVAAGMYGNRGVSDVTFVMFNRLQQGYYPSYSENSQTYSGHRASCTVHLRPLDYYEYYISPATYTMNAGSSYRFNFCRQRMQYGRPVGDPEILVSAAWEIVSSTGGMEGLSISSYGTTFATFTAGATAHSGEVVIRATQGAFSSTATITVVGGGTGGGIGDDWEGGGEQVLD